MAAINLKEQVKYLDSCNKRREEHSARIDDSVERFNLLVEQFREETKNLGKCWYHDIEKLCDTLLEGEFKFNGQLGNGGSGFYNGVWQDRSEAKIVMVANTEVQFYLFPPNKDSSEFYVIYHVQQP